MSHLGKMEKYLLFILLEKPQFSAFSLEWYLVTFSRQKFMIRMFGYHLY